jgi:hypothetical protein
MAQNPVIYGAAFVGVNGPSTLYTISPTTGAATPVGSGIGFGEVSALAFAPNGTTLYGVGRTIPAGTYVLLTIDTNTGAGTQIGPTGGVATFEDIAFRSDGVLFGYSQGSIWTINIATGAATMVGNQAQQFPTFGNALAFSPGGVLYTANEANLLSINTATGVLTPVIALTYSASFPAGLSRANGMKFHPVTGTLYASVVSGATAGSLGIIDVSTGNVSFIALTAAGMDALAISGQAAPPPPTPAPSTWLLLLTGMVALFGWKRWQAAHRAI